MLSTFSHRNTKEVKGEGGHGQNIKELPGYEKIVTGMSKAHSRTQQPELSITVSEGFPMEG